MTELHEPAAFEPAATTPDSRRPQRARRALVSAVIVLAVIAGGLWVAFPKYEMLGSSMAPTYESGDSLYLSRWSAIDRFDIAVAELDSNGTTSTFVKRVVGVGGDELRYEDCELFVNSERIAEPYVESSPDECGNAFEATVPDDHVFLLGDSRGASQDSRHFGPVAIDSIRGEIVYSR